MTDARGERATLPALLARPDSFQALLEAIDPSLYQALCRAVELRRWPDGGRLSEAQLETCMQALIYYEENRLPEDDRTRNRLPKGCGMGGPTGGRSADT